MGRIDVSDVLNDPDFVDPMIIIRRTASVTALGENSLSERKINALGSVQPASGKTLSRLPEELRIENMMSFWTNTLLSADKAGGYPDQIIYKNNRYNIKTVFDWSAWGDGWTEGLCVMERINLG
jgi:hypothetical protein